MIQNFEPNTKSRGGNHPLSSRCRKKLGSLKVNYPLSRKAFHWTCKYSSSTCNVLANWSLYDLPSWRAFLQRIQR